MGRKTIIRFTGRFNSRFSPFRQLPFQTDRRRARPKTLQKIDRSESEAKQGGV